MSAISPPTCTIIAGPNGAGKTTFAAKYFPEKNNFINADEIAKTLRKSPGRNVRAARLFLAKVKEHRKRRENFAIESTLSGTKYLKLISGLSDEGWQIDLYYLWIPDADASINRVSDRVALGGHDIPEKDVIRRYPRSVYNFMRHYMPLCDTTTCIDNSDNDPAIIFFAKKDSEEKHILQNRIYKLMEQVAKNEENHRRQQSERGAARSARCRP